MKLEYEKVGDYLLPKLEIPRQKKINLGKYALLRLNYLKNHKRGLYMALKMKNELNSHLEKIQNLATEKVENLIKEIAKNEGITEELKVQNQMEWVGRMNNVKNRAEEIVLKEIIYN